jgi:predicted glycosyltransferase
LIWNLKEHGHEVKITTRDKDVAIKLLNAYGFQHESIGYYSTLVRQVLSLVIANYRLLRIAKNFKPDIFISMGSLHAALVSKLLGKPSIVLDDTEYEHQMLYLPFIDAVLTSSCFKKDLGKKQVRYNGYHELAYLHPNYFTPDPSVLAEIGLDNDDRYVILRFVSWSGIFNLGQHGFNLQAKKELVRELEKYGRVFITSEGRLPKELEKYKIKVSPEKLHDLLYYASLYIGEGATTASECAVLGTHAIHVNTLRLGYTDEEEEKYNLVYNFSDGRTMEKEAFNKALELLENNNLREEGKRKREKLLNDKIDVTAFMIWFVENYPESFKEMKGNLDIQRRFKSKG